MKKIPFVKSIAENYINLHLAINDLISPISLKNGLLSLNIESNQKQCIELLNELCGNNKIKFVTQKIEDNISVRTFTSIIPRQEIEAIYKHKFYFLNTIIPSSYISDIILNRTEDFGFKLYYNNKENLINSVKIISDFYIDINENGDKVFGIEAEYNTLPSIQKNIESQFTTINFWDLKENFFLGGISMDNPKRQKTIYYAECGVNTTNVEEYINIKLNYYNFSYTILFINSSKNRIIFELEDHIPSIEIEVTDEENNISIIIEDKWTLLQQDTLELVKQNFELGNYSNFKPINFLRDQKKSICLDNYVNELLVPSILSNEIRRRKISTDGLTILGTTENGNKEKIKQFLLQFDSKFFVLYNRDMSISNLNPIIVISHLEESKHDRIKLFYRKQFGLKHTLSAITCRKISKVLKEL